MTITLKIDENQVIGMNQKEMHEYMTRLGQLSAFASPSVAQKLDDPEEKRRERVKLENQMTDTQNLIEDMMRCLESFDLKHSERYYALEELNSTIRADRYGKKYCNRPSPLAISEFSLLEIRKYQQCLTSVNLALNGSTSQERDQGFLQMAQHYDHLASHKKVYPHLTTDHRKSLMVCFGLIVIGVIAVTFAPAVPALLCVGKALFDTIALSTLLGGAVVALAGTIGMAVLDSRPNIDHSKTTNCGTLSHSLRNSFGLFKEVKETHRAFKYGDTAPSAPPAVAEEPWYPVRQTPSLVAV